VRKILIVCGAGASSTFLAHRMRAGARTRGLEATVRAETLTSLTDSLAGVDVLLVGPHLADRFDGIRREAALVGTAVALLPEDAFGAGGAEAALDTVEALLGSRTNADASTDAPLP
jgi:PTS system cellobiose-specific IIB component